MINALAETDANSVNEPLSSAWRRVYSGVTFSGASAPSLPPQSFMQDYEAPSEWRFECEEIQLEFDMLHPDHQADPTGGQAAPDFTSMEREHAARAQVPRDMPEFRSTLAGKFKDGHVKDPISRYTCASPEIGAG